MPAKADGPLPLWDVQTWGWAGVRATRDHVLDDPNDTLHDLLRKTTPLLCGGRGRTVVIGERDGIHSNVLGEQVHRYGRLELAGMAREAWLRLNGVDDFWG